MSRTPFSPAIICLCVALLAAACGCRPAERTAQPTVVAEFAAGDAAGLVLVPVTVGGAEQQFILDTGAARTIFDASLRPWLGRPRGRFLSTTPGGLVELRTYPAPRATLAGLPLPESIDWVACSDLSNLTAVCGRRISGILGMDFLGNFAVRIDFAARTVELLRSDGREHPEWGEALAIRYEDGCPNVAAELEGAGRHWFRIDTGANGFGALTGELFRRLAGSQKPGCINVVGGQITPRVGLLRALALGSRRHTAPEVFDGSACLLGLAAFSGSVATFDFPAGRLYLKDATAPAAAASAEASA